MSKLRELQVVGNPLDYPSQDIVKKGSKYLIRFLREKWNSDQNNESVITPNDEPNMVKKIDKKTFQKGNINSQPLVTTYKIIIII